MTAVETRQRSVSVSDVVVGERDREDLGDIAALAASIRAVGLLHPVVTTASSILVAGGRRLAAVKSLGWTHVPVTIVDLTTAGDVLRAEADENTERKPLTPYEASRARERRAVVLGDDAAKRKAQAPGRPRGERQSPVSSPNLGDETPKARETAKVAASGTGYSGSTLDKVDKVRSIAEKGVIPIGRGRERREIPAPPAVRDVAVQELEGMKQSGAAVDRAAKNVDNAIGDLLDSDPAVQDSTYAAKVRAAVSLVRAQFLSLDPERTADVIDDLSRLDALRTELDEWFIALDSHRNVADVLPFARSV
jgi:ParB family chromosome partitioning protein